MGLYVVTLMPRKYYTLRDVIGTNYLFSLLDLGHKLSVLYMETGLLPKERMNGLEENLRGQCICIVEGFLDIVKEMMQTEKGLRKSKRNIKQSLSLITKQM